MTTDATNEGDDSTALRWLVAILAILVVTTTAALIPHLLGYGWFGHRVLLYGQNELYVLNLDDEPRQIVVDDRTTRQIDADNAALVPLVGGTSTVSVYSPDGELLADRQLETDRSDVLYSLSDQACFVVSELSNLSADTPLEVDIVDRLGPEVDLYPLESRNIVWPRGYPGVLKQDSPDPALSVEVVDCNLLDDRAFLTDYITEQLEARR